MATPRNPEVAARITLDPSRCAGHGRCYALAPALFEADEEGHGRVLEPEPTAAHLDQARAAEANCPEGAIRVEA